MEMYLLKSAACLAILLLFYKLLLENEQMHRFKRFYLLGSVIVSIVVPWITFTTYVEVPALTSSLVYEVSDIQKVENATNFLPLILWSAYGLGVLFFSVVFLKNLLKLILKIRRNPKIRKKRVTNVLLKEEVIPHTFWDYIFLNKNKFEAGSIPQEVFQHEEAHAIQKHSFDILFMELLQIIFWFNPLIYLAKDAIKLNHEFLADEAVLQKGANTAIYQETLLSFSSHQRNSSLSHSINYSSIRLTVFGKTFSFGEFGQVKKRFTVMKTKTSKKAVLMRSFLLLPLLAVLLYSFSTKEVVLQEIPKENGKTEKQENSETILPLPNGEIVSVISSEEDLQETATPAMVKEYNKLAKFYNTNGVSIEVIDQKGYDQVQEDFARMRYIFKLMTPEQRKDAVKLPPPPPPPAPPAPRTADEISVIGYPTPQPPNPPAPPAPVGEDLSASPAPVTVIGYPAPPPPPPSPEEAVQDWIKEGAIFYYNGKEVSGKKALEIVRRNGGKNLSVQVDTYNSVKAVRLWDKEKNK